MFGIESSKTHVGVHISFNTPREIVVWVVCRYFTYSTLTIPLV